MLRGSTVMRALDGTVRRVPPAALALTALLSPSAAASEPGATCRACHAIQVDGYRATPMARALGPLDLAELSRVSPPNARVGELEYRFGPGERGARILESVWSSGGGAESLREIDSAPILFTIGAGIRDRSYAVRRGELMRFGPLEAVRDVAGGGSLHAQVSPGQAIDPGSRWNVPVAEECLRCHTSALPPRDFPYDLAPNAAWNPTGIDCGACHARSAEHAEWQVARADGATPSTSDPIANDSTARRTGFDSCARCHLQGDALLSIAEPMRGIPAPEADLFARRAVFVAAEPTHEIGFVSQVERLALSACFLATREQAVGALSCTTCHDPHRSATDAKERARVRNACAKCHASDPEQVDRASACSTPMSDREGRDCVDCHMRLTGVFDVASVLIHDHRIERQPPPPSPPGTLRMKAAANGRIARFTASGERVTDQGLDRGLWLMAYLDIGRRDLAWSLASRDPGAVADALPGFHHLRASLREEHQDFAGAESDLRRALELDPDQAESSVNLGGLLLGRDRDREAIELLTALLARHPRSDGALRNRAVAYLNTGQLAAGARDLEAAQRVQPSAPIARLLAQVYERLGERERARQWAERARALEPLTR
jgi:predicted CXXCH cytochrome family protein